MKSFHIYIFCFLLTLFLGCKDNSTNIDPDEINWNLATPESQGINSELLNTAFMEAESKGYIDAVIVIRNGFIVKEKYFNGYDVSASHNVMSVSKSFLSALTGIAIQQGYLDSLGEKVLDYFPEYVHAELDPRKHDITIEHLLSMRMGIAGESENNYSVYQELYSSDNWIKSTIEYPLVNDPGERIRYNTFQTHLLSAILSKAGNKSTLTLAEELLTNPMEITVDDWEQDPQGFYFGGNSMYFTPREMALLGYMYLNGGKLNEKQIVPENWVEFTLSPSTDFPANEWGTWKNYNYAYLWWLGEFNDYSSFMAYGYGGQFVICFPELDLIIVTTANNRVTPDMSNVQELGIFELVTEYILKAIKN